MSNFSARFRNEMPRLLPWSLLLIPLFYLLTAARTVVLGDPTEYTFVAHILGIAHPPGYAFMTLMGKLFQTLNPLGDIPWRTHLLSATAATLASIFVYGTIRSITRAVMPTIDDPSPPLRFYAPALFGALVVATAADFWQHAIHANPHIITAAFLGANLYLLTRWWLAVKEQGLKQGTEAGTVPSPDRWLLAFCFSAGLGVTHHPLTVFSFPAYALFILWLRPDIWRQGRILLRMVASALLGLSVWLYFPIRSTMKPAFGPDTMATLSGFLDHVLARGLTESLPFYSLIDQPDRALVFWSLLRLQHSLPGIFLAVLGAGWLFVFRPSPDRSRPLLPALLLYGLAFLGNYLFVINLRQQDIMAYLLGPFLLVGLAAGLGLLGLLATLERRHALGRSAVSWLLLAIFLLGPVLQIVRNLPLVSLAGYSEGQDYIEAVYDGFQGTGQQAVLLNDWEHMTPLWYIRFVEDGWQALEGDVQPILVSTDRPWLESVFDYLAGGPIYLSGYRRVIVDAGFRLRPRGPFYQVVEPGEASLPPELTPVQAAAGEIEVVGYDLPRTAVAGGDYVPLTLAMTAPVTPTHYYVPVILVGDLSYPFTTDSHLVTPLWRPGEVIVERFDFALPHDLAPGERPVRLAIKDLSTDSLIPLDLGLGTLQVEAQSNPVSTSHLLANFRQRVGLVSASARSGLLERRRAPWAEPMVAAPGDSLNLVLEWQSLAPAEESYTVFVHLIDQTNRPWVTLDYTPLGGSTPTHLWIPKWLPGQRMLDPYRLVIPADLSPGTYLIEVGLYEMTSGRRLHMADPAGNLIGDRYILGSVEIK
jgi:hypothetical protein